MRWLVVPLMVGFGWLVDHLRWRLHVARDARLGRLGERPAARCTADALAMHAPGACEECDYERAIG